jgi:hypothetical protein
MANGLQPYNISSLGSQNAGSAYVPVANQTTTAVNPNDWYSNEAPLVFPTDQDYLSSLGLGIAAQQYGQQAGQQLNSPGVTQALAKQQQLAQQSYMQQGALGANAAALKSAQAQASGAPQAGDRQLQQNLGAAQAAQAAEGASARGNALANARLNTNNQQAALAAQAAPQAQQLSAQERQQGQANVATAANNYANAANAAAAATNQNANAATTSAFNNQTVNENYHLGQQEALQSQQTLAANNAIAIGAAQHGLSGTQLQTQAQQNIAQGQETSQIAGAGAAATGSAIAQLNRGGTNASSRATPGASGIAGQTQGTTASPSPTVGAPTQLAPASPTATATNPTTGAPTKAAPVNAKAIAPTSPAPSQGQSVVFAPQSQADQATQAKLGGWTGATSNQTSNTPQGGTTAPVPTPVWQPGSQDPYQYGIAQANAIQNATGQQATPGLGSNPYAGPQYVDLGNMAQQQGALAGKELNSAPLQAALANQGSLVNPSAAQNAGMTGQEVGLSSLASSASGNGPTAASAQFQESLGQQIADEQQKANAAKGQGLAMAQQGALQQGTASLGAGAIQSAQTRAGEVNAAQGQYTSAANAFAGSANAAQGLSGQAAAAYEAQQAQNQGANLNYLLGQQQAYMGQQSLADNLAIDRMNQDYGLASIALNTQTQQNLAQQQEALTGIGAGLSFLGAAIAA